MTLIPVSPCWDARPRARATMVVAGAGVALMIGTMIWAGQVVPVLVALGVAFGVAGVEAYIGVLLVADRQHWRRRPGRVETSLRRQPTVGGAFMGAWLALTALVLLLTDWETTGGIAGSLAVLLFVAGPSVLVGLVAAAVVFARPSTLILTREALESTTRGSPGRIAWAHVRSVTTKKTPTGAMILVHAAPGIDVGPHADQRARLIPGRRHVIMLHWSQLDDPDEVFALIQECWELQDLPERWDVARSSG